MLMGAKAVFFVRQDVHVVSGHSGASVFDEVGDVRAFHFGYCVSDF